MGGPDITEAHPSRNRKDPAMTTANMPYEFKHQVMNKRPTRRRPARRAAARSLALVVAVAALVGIVGAGQALAVLALPDERVLERQGRIDRQTAVGQADAKGRVALPPQLSGEDKAASARAERARSGRTPAETPRRFLRPEPPMGPGPQLGDRQVAPSPVRTAPAGARGGLVVIVVLAALLAVGAATTWRVRHRRPQPESIA
jgi:hypothetical protein